MTAAATIVLLCAVAAIALAVCLRLTAAPIGEHAGRPGSPIRAAQASRRTAPWPPAPRPAETVTPWPATPAGLGEADLTLAVLVGLAARQQAVAGRPAAWADDTGTFRAICGGE